MTQPILVLRPEPGNAETMARLADKGLEAISLPLFEMRPLEWRAPDPRPFTGVMLTSANALRHAGADLASLFHLPAFAVGEATAQAARDAGFLSVVTGESTVARLLSHISTLGDHILIHLCGEDRTEVPLPPRLSLFAIPVYRADALDRVEALRQLGTASTVAMLHSPRAARHFADQADAAGVARGNIAIAATSHTVMSAAGTGWRGRAVADRTGDEALVALAAQLAEA
jgi:uroporphyrinogen-III synthase